MNNTIIEVNKISKHYNINEVEKSYLLRDEIVLFFKNIFRPKKAKTKLFYALKNVSFRIKRGEAVGIIGANGAGKSTLLKILSKITFPSSGNIKIEGRVASLLEVGTGFNPELTGRENIYLNGTILGMSRREINDKFDEIVKFAEIDKFLDTPVKKYSSGMYVRLAFSIAAHLEPEILLIDEVLAVGDARFQKKSLGKMNSVTKDKKRTIIFVSHDLSAIRKICDKCILLESGKVVKIGKTSDVINEYLDRINKLDEDSLSKIKRTGSGNIIVSSVSIRNRFNKPTNHAISGEPLSIVFNYHSKGKYNKVNLSFSIHSQHSQNLILHQSKYSLDYFDAVKGRGKIICKIDSLPLISGNYLINLRVDINGEEADFPQSPMYRLRVIDGDFYGTKIIPLQHSPILIKSLWKNIQLLN